MKNHLTELKLKILIDRLNKKYKIKKDTAYCIINDIHVILLKDDFTLMEKSNK